MIKSFYRLVDKKMIALLILMLVISPTLCGKNTYTICLIYSHYLTIYMNNVYLLMMYQYASRCQTLSAYIITRIGQQKFYQIVYWIFISIGLLFTIIIYISYYFFFGAIPSESFLFTIYFMIINIIVTGLESTLIYLQVGTKKNLLYLIFPIIINVLFHFLYTNLY